jgi:hypothetical protein
MFSSEASSAKTGHEAQHHSQIFHGRKLSKIIRGYGVVHYLPLDGTVFHDSRSVASKPFIGMGSLGLYVRHDGFALSFAATFFTDTFSEQRENGEFGTLSLSWDF